MNILHVISSEVAGGREFFCVPVALRQIAEGHTVSIMCKPGSPVDKEAKNNGINVIGIWFKGYFDPVGIFKAARRIRKDRFDIIHSHWTRDLSSLIVSSALAGRVPIVCTKHVYSTMKKMDIFHSWIFRSVKKVMCVCELVRKNLLETVPVDPSKAVTVYNGIDTAGVWSPGKYGNAFRKEEGIAENAFLVCMAGRINKGKGQHVLVEAAKAILKTRPEAVFVFAGRPEGDEEAAYLEAIKSDVKALGLEGSIRFLGFRNDLPAIMDASDAVVMCSAFETFGLVVIQGMAMAKPVVATRSGGVLELISEGVDGFLFVPGDHQELASILTALANDPGKRLAAGKNARSTAVAKFDISRTVDGINSTYLACVSERPKTEGSKMKKGLLIAGAVVLLGIIAAFVMWPKGPDLSVYDHLKEPQINKIEKQKVIAMTMTGEPGKISAEAIKALYKVYYGLKGIDKSVFPAPKARWTGGIDTPADKWSAEFAIRVPEEVIELPEMKDGPKAELKYWQYGDTAEILYTGPYGLAEEKAEIDRLTAFVKDNKYKITGKHEEEYLKGPGMFFKGDPKGYKTIIRYTVSKGTVKPAVKAPVKKSSKTTTKTSTSTKKTKK